jgi:hypothetical protein
LYGGERFVIFHREAVRGCKMLKKDVRNHEETVGNCERMNWCREEKCVGRSEGVWYDGARYGECVGVVDCESCVGCADL